MFDPKTRTGIVVWVNSRTEDELGDGDRPDELHHDSIIASSGLIQDMIREIKAIIDGKPMAGAVYDEEAGEETLRS